MAYGSNGDYAGRDRFGRPRKGGKAECPILPNDFPGYDLRYIYGPDLWR